MEARRLRRSLERFYLTEGRSNSVRLAMPKGGYVPEFQHALAVQSDSNFAPGACAREGFTSSRLVDPRHAIRCRRRFFHRSQLQRWVHPPAPGWTEPISRALRLRPHRRGRGQFEAEREPPRDSPQVDFVLSGSTAVFADVLNVKATLADAAYGRGHLGTDLRARAAARGILSARDSIADCIVRTLAQPFGVMFVNRYGLGRRCEGRRSAGI